MTRRYVIFCWMPKLEDLNYVNVYGEAKAIQKVTDIRDNHEWFFLPLEGNDDPRKVMEEARLELKFKTGYVIFDFDEYIKWFADPEHNTITPINFSDIEKKEDTHASEDASNNN